jgi:hypothetical protein
VQQKMTKHFIIFCCFYSHFGPMSCWLPAHSSHRNSTACPSVASNQLRDPGPPPCTTTERCPGPQTASAIASPEATKTAITKNETAAPAEQRVNFCDHRAWKLKQWAPFARGWQAANSAIRPTRIFQIPLPT